LKKLALFAAALTGLALAGADPVAAIFYTETQPANRALPTGTCGTGGQGASLVGVTSMHLLAQCSDQSAFTAGWAQAYFCDPGVGAWAKAASYNDFQLPAGGVYADGGSQWSVGPELVVTYPFGRFLYAIDGGACAGSGWDGGITTTLARGQR
jgi:hypothetical protein